MRKNKLFRRILLLLMTVLLLPWTVGAKQYGFLDVPADAWYHDSVVQAYNAGLINGKNQFAYDPNGSLTLAECIKLAVCIHQLEATGAITLKNGEVNWYDTYLHYAMEKGIINLLPTDPSEAVSRSRVAEIFETVLASNGQRINAGTRHYVDVQDERLPYYDAVYKLYQCGIMIGDDGGRFCPNDPISRGEMAAVVVRMIDETKRIRGEIALCRSVSVPVLMYHHFDTTARDYTTTPETFRSHLAMFLREGYTTIDFAALLRYTDGEDNLPEKPILLVSDDGYCSVLTYALPLLREFDMKMSVAVIGKTVGLRGEGKLPKFTLEEEAAADSDDRLELVSHSYGFHDLTSEMSGAVNLALDGAIYESVFDADCRLMGEMGGEENPMMKTVFVYPFGKYSEKSEALLRKNGYRVTVTTDMGIAALSPGKAPLLLPRITAEWYATGEALLAKLK